MIRRSWMMGGSVEAALELWASSLRDVKGRMRPLFQQDRMAASAGLFLDALLGPERRKTGWMRAEAAGDPGPWRQQALLGRALWDASAGPARAGAVGRRCASRRGARLRGRDARRAGCGSRHRRDGLLEAGQGILRGGPPVHGVSGQDHELPDWRVCRLRVPLRACLHRPGAVSPEGLDG